MDDARKAMIKNKHIFIALPTGGGKTIIFSKMTEGAFRRKYRVWIIVPRNELLKQSSKHLKKYNIPHGIINAKSNESRAFLVHLVSKSTLQHRWDKIKNWPTLIILDEGHLNYKFQMDLKERIPEKTRMIGFSATPERLSGEGLSDIYDSIIYGPSIRELVELDFLTKIKYFSPPLIGLENLHKKGSDIDADELAKLFKKRAVYGKAINHYKDHGEGKSAFVFCRSVKASEETAKEFRDAGCRFESLDGKMSNKKREAILTALETGEIQGVCSCEILIYGIDIPRIEVIIMLRPTFSRTYFMQMIGRGLRPYPRKDCCIVLDHVSNLQTHGHPLQDHEWLFYGRDKNKKFKGISPDTLKLCPKCFLYYEGTVCPNCGVNRDTKKRKPLKEIDGRLIEIEGPIKLADRDPEDKKEYADRITADIEKYREAETDGSIDLSAIEDLIKAGEDLGYNAMWVYHKLSATYTDKKGVEVDRKTVNTPLLYAISKIKGYKSGWAWMKIKELRGHK